MMRRELFENELNEVNGGTVIISRDYMIIGFDTTGEMYHLTNCTFKQARDLRDDLFENHKQESNEAFDRLVKEAFDANGWLGAAYHNK